MGKKMEKFLQVILRGQPLTREQVLNLIKPAISKPSDKLLDIMSLARLSLSTGLTTKTAGSGSGDGPHPFTCGIVNAKSGRCAENCSFCAQSRHYRTKTPIYPLMTAEALLDKARQVASNKVDYLGLVISGTKPSQADFDQICEAAVRIISRTGLKLCASLGIITYGQALALKQSGFSSYHHNLESARSFYPQVCGTHSFEARVETIQNARKAGLRTCSGGIFGLGESWEQRLEMAGFLRELAVDSIPVNFLIPMAGTPLEKSPLLSPAEALLIIALFRLMNPGRDIVICGGRGKVLNEWDRLIFSAGANGLMIGDYLTTKGHPFDRDLQILSELGWFAKRREAITSEPPKEPASV